MTEDRHYWVGEDGKVQSTVIPEPGPDLDALVAKHVMGWKHVYSSTQGYGERWELPDGTFRNTGGEVLPGLLSWRPSTDIVAAFEVIEHLMKDNLATGLTLGSFTEEMLEVNPHRKRQWHIGIGHRASGSADTAAHAICLAALEMAMKGPTFSCEGPCWECEDLRCKENDGRPVECGVPTLPLHEGCVCVIQGAKL